MLVAAQPAGRIKEDFDPCLVDHLALSNSAYNVPELHAIAVQKTAVIVGSDPSPGGAGSAPTPAAVIFTLRGVDCTVSSFRRKG